VPDPGDRAFKAFSKSLERAVLNVSVLTEGSLTSEFFASLELTLRTAALAAAESDPQRVVTKLESTRREVPARQAESWWEVVDRVVSEVCTEFGVSTQTLGQERPAISDVVTSEMRLWAEHWLVGLVRRGGKSPELPSRTLLIQDGEKSRPTNANSIREDRAELANPVRVDGHEKSGRAALTFDHPHDGQTALWIEAVRYNDGSLAEHVILLVRYRAKRFGSAEAILPIRDVRPDEFQL
jgi:hypothetical protein